ncbi:hypothetical protein [Pantoea eucrina]|uniref:hypothetical protein n=1 Tax=Pantoea eucrina TaxID=472693 RepID=UPI002FDB5890
MYKAMKFYVSDHFPSGLLLHRIDCPQLPSIEERTFIGSCYTLNQALTVAGIHFAGVKVCPFCISKPDEKEGQNEYLVLNTPKKPKKPAEKKIFRPVKHLDNS